MDLRNTRTSLNIISENFLSKGLFQPAEPLWKRVPTRDENGRSLSDFMMLFPGIKNKSGNEISDIIKKLKLIFDIYSDKVVFVDFNLRVNVLWVSIKPVPGLIIELAAAIHSAIPEAKLVSHKY